MIAKANGFASIDMVDINFKGKLFVYCLIISTIDMSSFTVNCNHGACLGFDGKQTIHPAQLEAVNSAYSPSIEQINKAKELLAEIHKRIGQSSPTNIGSFNFKGVMIDRPTIKQAVTVADQAKLLEIDE